MDEVLAMLILVFGVLAFAAYIFDVWSIIPLLLDIVAGCAYCVLTDL